MNRGRGVKYRELRVVKRLHEAVVRLRHFRGHGVHSPYVYNIVRGVFMRRTLITSNDQSLYEALRKENTKRSIAVDLQNLATICGYKSFAINSNDSEFVILTDCTSQDQTLRKAMNCGATVAILRSRPKVEFEQIKREMDRNHKSTLISRREYLLIFNNHLPKQRFIL
ncbi:MAG: hypothetical protein SNH55_02160 [Rikenellaceae bacterium]